MKHFRNTTLTLFSVLALLFAAPAMAQHDDATHDATALEEAAETERTNPDSRLISPHGGLTITGEVTEIRGDEQIVLDTTTGAQHIQLTDDTTGLVGLDVGDDVAVDYMRTSQGVMIAKQIRPFDADTDVTESRVTRVADEPDTVAVDTETELEAEVEEDFREGREEVRDELADIGNELENVDNEIEEELDRDYDVDVDERDETMVAELPATGSNLPLIGLIGLVAFGAAIGFRVFR